MNHERESSHIEEIPWAERVGMILGVEEGLVMPQDILPVGLQFQMRSGSEVNEFACHVRDNVRQRAKAVGANRLSTYPTPEFEKIGKKKNFLGKLDGYAITILPLDLSFVPNGAHPYQMDPVSGYTFATEVGMHSTGRGRIGTMRAKSTVYTGVRRTDGTHVVGLVTRSTNTAKSDKEIEALVAQSNANWEAVQRKGVMNPFSGGLPGTSRR